MWRWTISKRTWVIAKKQFFIFALKIFGTKCVCHQCRKVSNKDEIKMGQSDWGRRGCEENLIGFCSCTSRKMICFWQLCRSCQQNASLSKINDGGGVWRQSLVKYWTWMSYICKFSAQWMISALLSLQNVDENLIKNESSLSLLLDVICMRMRAVWWFHSLVEGLHGVSGLLSKSSSLPIGPFDILYMCMYCICIYIICFTAWLRVCTELVGYLASQVAANRCIHRYLTNSPPTQYSLYDIICQIFQEVSAFLQIGNPSGLWLILSLIRKTYNIWSKQKRQIYF